ncbi:MAG: 2-C-methyl-D-erythritol 4-phosphate cytidylyltransferase [Candidatus Saganbacteria bacterium]|uniref:2-C-methyl-D-erythritol 4-phosphate cytidylyltransferase n=1 Tax=Candidatus Saganbacteria bacterium TaxID=2575572 RepID=A0A833NY09_UNCSA|nr:MAG: 2-C-methyl-D-erythritol 4-phosphate cytidylyltransferase [Candidatus Saganbacteria bacterium]
MKISVIIAAGGFGRRMGKPKQFLPLLGKSVIEWTLDVFKSIKTIKQIVLVVSGDDIGKAKSFGVEVVEGGVERQDSVSNGLKLISADTDFVIVHDGARPLITPDIIEKAISDAKIYGAAVVGVPIKDTLKRVDKDLMVCDTVDRSIIWQAQTPQVFKYEIITRAYKNAKSKATDDSKLVEDLGIKVKMVMGLYENIKITTPEDLIAAEAIIRRRNDLSKL